jgi:hypothetical protein
VAGVRTGPAARAPRRLAQSSENPAGRGAKGLTFLSEASRERRAMRLSHKARKPLSHGARFGKRVSLPSTTEQL